MANACDHLYIYSLKNTLITNILVLMKSGQDGLPRQKANKNGIFECFYAFKHNKKFIISLKSNSFTIQVLRNKISKKIRY